VNTDIKNKNSFFQLLKSIISYLDTKRKSELLIVVVLSIFSSLAESISIALLIPFISFFISPETYLFNSFFVNILEFFNFEEKRNILGFVTFIFVFFVLISFLIKLQYVKKSNSLTDNISSDFRIKIFNFLINQDFKFYFTHGANEIMSNLAQKSGSFTTVIFAAINILNSLLILFAVTTVLIINEPFYTPIIILSVVIFFFIIYKIKSEAVFKKGQNINLNQNFLIDIFENTVGYLQEIIIYDLKNFFSSSLSKTSIESAKFSAQIRTISMLPKIYLESFIIIFVVSFIYFSNFSDRPIAVNISYLAILAFGAQKCLPLINGVYNFSINFKGAMPRVLNCLKFLEKGKSPKIEENIIDILDFKNKIKLKNISFKYNKDLPNILENINLEISKGEKILIKGQTGSGKSTIINIISGLLDPSQGSLFVDDSEIHKSNKKNWQKNIAIVPQAVFLNDASILENIAIGVEKNEIDANKVKKSALTAHIHQFIDQLPNKYNEKVGENGVRLSGGQRQRISIARALYRNAKVLILDEPTNALDIKTEEQLINTLIKISKDITIIMISHNSSSMKYFDRVIDLENI